MYIQHIAALDLHHLAIARRLQAAKKAACGGFPRNSPEAANLTSQKKASMLRQQKKLRYGKPRSAAKNKK